MLQGDDPDNAQEIFDKEWRFIHLLKSHFPSLYTKYLYNEYVACTIVLFCIIVYDAYVDCTGFTGI